MSEFRKSNIYVVIPTYNRSEDLHACLESLVSAGLDEAQIVIMDNCSVDDTVERVQQEFPETVLFALESNLGATGASNIGFNFALEQGAQFVLRLDSDTVVNPDFLKPLLQAAFDDPQIGIVAPKIYYYQPPDEIWYAGAEAHLWHFGAIRTHRYEKDAPRNSSPREVDYAWGAAMLIKRQVLEKTKGFDTDFFVYYEELDFCRRVQKLGYKIFYEPQSKIWHKVGSSANNAWTAYHWNRSKMLFFKKHAKNTPHRVALVAYAFLYAFFDEVMKVFALRDKSGNRGPLKYAIKGLSHGLSGTMAENLFPSTTKSHQ